MSTFVGFLIHSPGNNIDKVWEQSNWEEEDMLLECIKKNDSLEGCIVLDNGVSITISDVCVLQNDEHARGYIFGYLDGMRKYVKDVSNSYGMTYSATSNPKIIEYSQNYVFIE